MFLSEYESVPGMSSGDWSISTESAFYFLSLHGHGTFLVFDFHRFGGVCFFFFFCQESILACQESIDFLEFVDLRELGRLLAVAV